MEIEFIIPTGVLICSEFVEYNSKEAYSFECSRIRLDLSKDLPPSRRIKKDDAVTKLQRPLAT
jgi:hypothetical protein